MKLLKLILAFYILHSAFYIVPAQNRTLDSLRNVVSELESSANSLPIRVSWDWMPDYPIKYDVYYCSSDDTTIMPLRDGINGDTVADWMTGSTIYNYFWVKQPLKRFLRIGIVGISDTGQRSLMKCYTYDYQ